jgi:hypothetical protein
MAYATGSAKRQLALLKGAGWRVAVVPFHELHLGFVQQQQQQQQQQSGPAKCGSNSNSHGSSRGNASTCKQFVADLLKEQCGDVAGFLLS